MAYSSAAAAASMAAALPVVEALPTAASAPAAAAAAAVPVIERFPFYIENHDSSPLSPYFVCWIRENGRYFPTVQHYYQAQKYVLAGHPDTALLFSTDRLGGNVVVGQHGIEAKRAGSAADMALRGVHLDASHWKHYKVPMMRKAYTLLLALPRFQRMLELTKPRPIVYKNKYVHGFWGFLITKTATSGDNMLGHLLEELRGDGTAEEKAFQKIIRDASDLACAALDKARADARARQAQAQAQA